MRNQRWLFSYFESELPTNSKFFILQLYKELGEDPIVVLDGTRYFQESSITELITCVDFSLLTFTTYSPELDPVEECWRQLQNALSNRFLDSLDKLTVASDTTLDQLPLQE